MGRDYAFEALAEVTATDWSEGRGELNAALKSLKEQEPILADDSYLLGAEIHERAKMYRDVMGDDILLTPSSLAKHWKRVKEHAPKKTYPQPVLVYDSDDGQPRVQKCDTCDGHKLVLTGYRPAVQTIWMESKGIVPNPNDPGYEEWALCPDCNSHANADSWRADGSRFRPLDPELVRARMRTT